MRSREVNIVPIKRLIAKRLFGKLSLKVFAMKEREKGPNFHERKDPSDLRKTRQEALRIADINLCNVLDLNDDFYVGCWDLPRKLSRIIINQDSIHLERSLELPWKKCCEFVVLDLLGV
jgi:hypothetical protein